MICVTIAIVGVSRFMSYFIDQRHWITRYNFLHKNRQKNAYDSVLFPWDRTAKRYNAHDSLSIRANFHPTKQPILILIIKCSHILPKSINILSIISSWMFESNRIAIGTLPLDIDRGYHSRPIHFHETVRAIIRHPVCAIILKAAFSNTIYSKHFNSCVLIKVWLSNCPYDKPWFIQVMTLQDVSIIILDKCLCNTIPWIDFVYQRYCNSNVLQRGT